MLLFLASMVGPYARKKKLPYLDLSLLSFVNVDIKNGKFWSVNRALQNKTLLVYYKENILHVSVTWSSQYRKQGIAGDE